MPTQRTAAVVIGVADHAESDKLVSLYTRHQGKLTCIAKGAKRSLKRFVNKLELFSLLDIEYATASHSSLARLDQAELTNPFPALRHDYHRFVAASIVCELIRMGTRDHDTDPALFSLLTWSLDNLNRQGPVLDTLILFHTRLFGLLGYRPMLTACVLCHSLAPEKAPFSFRAGRNGIVCGRCGREIGSTGIPLSLSTLKLLGKAQELPRHKLERLRFSNGSAREATAMLRHYASHLFQREIHSWKYLSL